MAVNRNFANNYYIGGGELYVKIKGEENFRYFGQTESASVSFNVEKVEHKNSEGAILTTDLEVTKAVSAEISIQTADLNPTTLALAFSGEYNEVKQTSATGLEVDITSAAAGAVYELGKRKVKNVEVTYKDGDEDIPAEEGVDYSVDYEFGTVEIAKDGVLAGKDAKVTFDCDAVTIGTFTSLNKTSQEVALRFISKPLHGKPSKTEIFRANLNLDGDFALKSAEDIQKITLKGKVLKDTTRPEGQQFLVKEVLA